MSSLIHYNLPKGKAVLQGTKEEIIKKLFKVFDKVNFIVEDIDIPAGLSDFDLIAFAEANEPQED